MKRLFVLLTTLAVVLGIGIMGTAVAAGAASPSSANAANADFRGVWNGGTWIIKTENFKTGVCSGTANFIGGSGYALTNCVVTGDSYVLTITDTLSGTTSPWYYSYNSGTIVGNTANGIWHDTNSKGGSVSFARSASVSTTKITAKPQKATKGASVSYSVHVSSAYGSPTGKVQVRVGRKLLGTIKLSNGAGTLRTTKTPQGKRELVRASYAGSSLPPFLASKGSAHVTVAK